MLDHDDVECQLSLELHLVERGEIGRVGNGDGQAITPLAQRKHPRARDQLLVDDVARQLLEVERGQVQHRMPERLGCEPGDRACAQAGDVRRVGQFVDELRIGLRGLAGKVFRPVGPQLALLDKGTRETCEGPRGGRTLRYGGHGVVRSLEGQSRPKL